MIPWANEEAAAGRRKAGDQPVRERTVVQKLKNRAPGVVAPQKERDWFPFCFVVEERVIVVD